MENLSPTVLLRMVEFLQSELNAASQRNSQLESINDAQASVIRTLRSDLSATQGALGVYMQGSEVITRAVDGMYQHARHLFLIQRLEASEWDEFMRQMMRADIGFAILNNVNFLDATETLNNEETEVDEDETEDEMED